MRARFNRTFTVVIGRPYLPKRLLYMGFWTKLDVVGRENGAQGRNMEVGIEPRT